MITLAVDTSAGDCAACVYDSSGRGEIGRSVERIGRGHAERLFPVIAHALQEAGVVYSDLQRLGVCIGPGSFTGLRVGVSAMRGLSLALGIPLVGVTAFDALMVRAQPGKPALVALDARRGEVYAQLFDAKHRPAGDPAAMPPEAAADIAVEAGALLLGSGAALVAGAQDAPGPSPVVSTVDIGAVAELAAEMENPADSPKPLYLRAADAKPQAGFAVSRREIRP